MTFTGQGCREVCVFNTFLSFPTLYPHHALQLQICQTEEHILKTKQNKTKKKPLGDFCLSRLWRRAHSSLI